MSVITFPDSGLAAEIEWNQLRGDMEFSSVFGSQSQEITAPVWEVLLKPRNFTKRDYAEWESLSLGLHGRRDQLALWHLDRAAPQGTMRGSMVFSGAHARGANSVSIYAPGQAGTTLLQGDHIGFGSGLTQQVVKVQADAMVGLDDIITVSVESFLRNAFADGSEITWNKPKALFRRSSTKTGMKHSSGVVNGLALDLIEDWRP